MTFLPEHDQCKVMELMLALFMGWTEVSLGMRSLPFSTKDENSGRGILKGH